VPTTDSGRWVTAAIWVTGIALVLVASTAPSRQIRSSSRKTSCLMSIFSKTASTTMSASAAAASSTVVVMRPRAAAASSADNLPLAANRSSDVRMPETPRSRASSVTSRSTTWCPAVAATCAMPEPISPDPTTATLSIRGA
jgi:hypothetical protein